jgi:hypothetical protein
VKLIYMDESGTGSIEREPFMFVTAVIVDADTKWRRVNEDIGAIIDEHIPAEDREGFAFHATNLFHGGKYFGKKVWSRPQRWKILSQLVQLIEAHRLPIAYGILDRKSHESAIEARGSMNTRDKMAILQASAFAYCAMACEVWLQTFTDNETGLMIAEDNSDVRFQVRHYHTQLKNPDHAFFKNAHHDYQPLSQVIDTVHFATKPDTRILQLADVSAFLLRRTLAGFSDVDQFIKPIEASVRWQSPNIFKRRN